MIMSNQINKTKIRKGNPSILLKCLVFCITLGLTFSLLMSQDTQSIASGEVIVQGVSLQVDPSQQTVPINTETIVNTIFSVENEEILDGMVVKGTLRGPGFKTPITLTTLPNHPFAIPGFTVKGTYILENIHLERDGKELVSAQPGQVSIEAMDIIVTRVESRPLTLEEIREKGIVISEENFSVYNFSVGFIINSEEVRYDFPIVYSGNNDVYIPSTGGSLNLGAVTGRGIMEPLPIQFDLPEVEIGIDSDGAIETSKSISGVVIFNNDIAFLHQFFSVMFIVSNNAPEGSPLSLKNLTAKITYPEGLREAETNPPHITGTPIPVHCPGPDGKIGTSDDLNIIMATFSGMSEFLAEGLKEGTHIVKIDFEGTLSGLPSGDTPVSGTASGAVIVRNPEFGITFAHPSVIRKGEEYDILITMTNTSPVTANLVSLTMPTSRLVGTSLLSDETVSYETIIPGESVNAKFHMRANETGKIRASAFEADSNVSGKFVLTAGVGEKGIPLSPDTLVLPEWAYSLPAELINASLLLLGEAYSIATTPPGGLPDGLPYISADLVKARAVEFADAGQRYSYGDSLERTLEVLTLDWLGSTQPDINFDILRRLTSKGLTFAEQQTKIFEESLANQTPDEFQLSFAQNCSYKAPFISAILSFSGGTRIANLRIIDYYHNSLSNELGSENLIRNIPYGELYLMKQNQSPVDFALIGNLDDNGYKIEILGLEEGNTDLALIIPDISGNFRQIIFSGIQVKAGSISKITLNVQNTEFILSQDNNGDGQEDSQINGTVTLIQEPSLNLISAIQECSADSAGHATALFFNRPLDSQTATDKTNYYIEGKSVYASFLQPSGRVVLIGTNNPISPFVESRVKVENLKDTKGNSLTPSPVEMAITATIKTPGGIVYGQVLNAAGQAINNAKVQLIEINGSKRNLCSDVTDSSGNFQFDFVRILTDPFRLEVMDPSTGKLESITGRLLSNGQRLQIILIMRGRGTVKGKVLDTTGNAISGATVTAAAQSIANTSGTSLERFSQVTNEQGEFSFTEIPVGQVGLSAGKSSLFGTAATQISEAGQTQTVNITVVSGKYATISGRVLASDGVSPIAETYVNIFGESSFASGTQTDDQGYFQFSIVPVGTFNITAYNPLTGKVGGGVNGEVVEGQSFNATIILRGSGRVYGKAYSYQGVPLENVLIYLNSTSFFMDTDSNGNFNFEEIPVGNYTITAYNRSTATQTSASVKLISEGQEVYTTIVFPNTLKGAIRGTLLDINGVTPISNVQVFAVDLNFFARGVAKTNSDGSFQIDNLIPGTYIIFAIQGEKCGVTRATVQFAGHIAQCNLQFLGKGKVNINVFASDGQTGIMADVTFRRLIFIVEEGSRVGFYGKEEQYTTDENGHLEIDDVFQGDFTVTAENPFYPRGAYNRGSINSPGQEVDVDLVMLPTGKVKLHVVNWDGQTPVPGAMLSFSSGTLNYKGINADDSGDYEFTLVPPGSFKITAEDSVTGFKGIRYGTMGQDGDLVETTLRLLGQGQVNGVVKNQSGGLIPNVKIIVKNIGYPNETFQTTTDSTGHFVITGVWEGQFTVSAYDSISHTGGVSRGEISGNNAQANIEVFLDPIGSVTGKVLSPDGVMEMLDCQVVLYHSRFSYAAVGYFYVSEEGGYRFDNIPSGQFYLEAFHPPSGRKGRVYNSITTEGEVKEVNVLLEGRGTVTGTFFDGSRVNPIPYAEIKISTDSQYPFTLVSSTNSDGVFTFENVGKGTFDLVATDPSNGLHGTSTGQVEYDGDVVEIDVVAQGWGSVKGTVYYSNGSTIAPNARLSLKQGSKTYSAYADTNGNYRFDFLPTGSFTVSAYEQPGERDYGTAAGTVEFHGQEAVVNISFKGLGTVKGQVLDGGGNPKEGIPVTLKSGTETYTISSGATQGEFQFTQLRMGTFSISATEPGTNLSGTGSGELTSDGQEVTVNLVLESAGTVQGRVLCSDGVTPAENAYVKLKGSTFTQYFSTTANGEFAFNAVRLGSFTIEIQGYDNSGKARVYGQIDSHGDVENFGDVALDNVLPQINSFSPQSGSSAVPLTGTASVIFSEPMAATSITTDTVKLTSPQGKVAGTVTLSPDLKSVVYTPSSPLASFSLYTLLVSTSVQDIAGNSIEAPVSTSFTTSDIQPPVVSLITPANNATGIPITTPITVTFNEPVDNGNFSGQNLSVSKGGVAITGGISFLPGNQSVIFTPNALESDSIYNINVNGARDYAGNIQIQTFTSTFATIDTIAPTITLQGPASGTTVIESSTVQVTANTGSSTDVAVVYFFINGELKGSDKTSPYTFTFSAPLISQTGSTFLVETMAEDSAGNQSIRANLTFTLQGDSAPQIILTGPAQSNVFPGATINCSVTAQDDLGLGSVTLTAIGGTLNYSDTQSWTTTQTTFTKSYTISVPGTVLPNTTIILHAEAIDRRGNTSGATDISLLVPNDEQNPTITIESPIEGAHFKHNEVVTITASASDDIGLKEVRLYLNDQLLNTLSQEPFTTSYTVPPLEEELASVVKVEAEDLVGKTAQSTVNITLEQLVDLTAPQIKILSPSSGSQVYAEEALKVKVEATDDEGIDHVDILVNDQLLQSFTESPYEADYTIPSDAVTGSTITIKAIATDVDNKTGTSQSILNVVTGTILSDGTIIEADDDSYDNQTIIIGEGTVTINGAHTFQDVLIKGTSTLTHSTTTTTSVFSMELTLTGKLIIGADAKINVTNQGYLGARRGGNTSLLGYTLGNTTTGGSSNGSGGSYGGWGGQYGTSAANKTYGSIIDPNLPGSGGGSTSTSYYAGSGGGVIRITSTEIVNDGQILSNGYGASSAGGGSGGSIKIKTDLLRGSGLISANGGNGTSYTGGGGGRIAVYYGNASEFDLNKITAYGGSYTNGTDSARNGSSGTVYLKQDNQEAQLIIDNNTVPSDKRSLFPQIGPGTITDLSSTTLTDGNASFMTGSLIGMKLIPDMTNKQLAYTIIDNTKTSITINSTEGDLTAVAAIGDTYGGIALFDGHLYIRNETLSNIDGDAQLSDLSVLSSSHLGHSPTSTTREYYLSLNVTGKVTVESGSYIDVCNCGYLGARRGGNTSLLGYTLGNTTTGGSSNGSGGSYGGKGGIYGTGAVNEVYGSLYNPNSPGSGGGSTYNSYWAGSGGGVIGIQCSEFIIDGIITANGYGAGSAGGGSGGSIKIVTGILKGSGSITANGGNSGSYAAGGGGRIAVYYEDAKEFNLDNITTYGGSYTGGTISVRNGGAGTIYLEKKGETGTLIIDNNTLDSDGGTPVLGGAPGTITALEAYKLVDDYADFIPNSLIGLKIIPNTNRHESYTITSNTRTEIFTVPADGDMTLTAAVGDTYGYKYTGNVILDGSNVRLNGTYYFSVITLINSTLKIDGNLEVDSLKLQNGSKVTHSPATTTTVYSLQINASELVIDEGSSIDVTNCGYLGARRGGNLSLTGYTLGNTIEGGSSGGSGGSYGGWGGQYGTSAVNKTYGSIIDPNHPGSGGGSTYNSYWAGSGGGVIRITSTEIVNNGQILSNGYGASSAGGGSGGSIKIKTDLLRGSGSISANGGNGTSYTGGGGGRIAVNYGDASEFDLNKITAYGGSYTNGTDSARNGSSGTVYLKQENQEAQLIIDNNTVLSNKRRIFPLIEPGTISDLSSTVLTDVNASFMNGSLIGMELIPDMNNKEQTFTIVDNTKTTITIDSSDGDLTTVSTIGSIYGGIAVFNGHLIVRNTTYSYIDGDAQLSDLSVLSSSHLGHSPTSTTREYYLSLNVTGKVTVETGSYIGVSNCGYLGARRGGNDTNYGCTLGNTTTGGSISGSGGSYGGKGGKYGTYAVNNVYGSLYNPSHPGSGGGTNYYGNPAGSGGGVIHIHCSELILNGIVNSDGYGASSAGGGSGGSIKIVTGILKGSGSITANGGNSGSYTAGGGGRIAISYDDASEFNLDNIMAHGGSYTNGTSSTSNGGAGTVYLKQSTATYGDLIVNNNNIPCLSNSTPLPAVGQGFNTLLEANHMVNSSGTFILDSLLGIKLNPQPTGSTLFTIIKNNGTEIFTDSADGDMTQIGVSGGAYVGEHLFHNVTIKGNAQVFTTDRIQVSGTLITESGSTLVAENLE